MANTTKLADHFLQIKGLDEDWSVPGDLPGFKDTGLYVKSITFYPSAANDILLIKQGLSSQGTTAAAIATTVTAAGIMEVKAATGDPIRFEFDQKCGSRMWPFIDISDCTFGTAGNARIDIELA